MVMFNLPVSPASPSNSRTIAPSANSNRPSKDLPSRLVTTAVVGPVITSPLERLRLSIPSQTDPFTHSLLLSFVSSSRAADCWATNARQHKTGRNIAIRRMGRLRFAELLFLATPRLVKHVGFVSARKIRQNSRRCWYRFVIPILHHESTKDEKRKNQRRRRAMPSLFRVFVFSAFVIRGCHA